MSWIIPSADDLSSTVYMEVLPGPYEGECWNDASIYFSEEAFGYLEPIIKRHWPSYGHYAFNEIGASAWKGVLKDLNEWRDQLDKGARAHELNPTPKFIFQSTRGDFVADEDENLRTLWETVEQFSRWIEEKLEQHETISILGI